MPLFYYKQIHHKDFKKNGTLKKTGDVIPLPSSVVASQAGRQGTNTDEKTKGVNPIDSISNPRDQLLDSIRSILIIK